MLSKLLTRREQLVLLALAGGLLVGSVTLYALRRTSRPEVAEALTISHAQPAASVAVPQVPSQAVAKPEAPVTAVAPAAVAPASVTISVRGAVAQPGVFEFTDGARVQEAVDRAGGALETADLSDVNLAARLLDGTTLTVPAASRDGGRFAAGPDRTTPGNPPEYTISGWHASPEAAQPADSSGPKPNAGAAGDALDLNMASEAELQALPGIGPKLASQIIQYRAGARFKCVEDIQEVSGIGPKKLESIRPFVIVR